MADNTQLNTGTGGDVIATDDIAGVKYQRVKVTYGIDGVATDVSNTDPLPADVRELGGVAVDLGAGAAGGGTQRVVIATDQATIPINDGGGTISVDGSVSITGTVTVDMGANNDIQGDVAHDAVDSGNPVKIGGQAQTALPAAVIAGDRVNATLTLTGGLMVAGSDGANAVNVRTDAGGAVAVQDNGGSLTIDNSTLAVVGGGAEATALRVTIANNSTGVLTVDDGGASLTVDAPIGTPVNVQVGNGTAAAGVQATQADDVSNAVNGLIVSAFGYVFDGTTWDRVRGTAADGLLVNLGTNNDVTVTGTVTANAGTGPWPVTDNGGSLTVDAPLGTPVNVQVGDGTNAVAVQTAGADDVANAANRLQVSGFLYGFDGTAWDRLRGTAADGLQVNLAGNNDVQGAGAHDAAVTGNPFLVGAEARTTNPTAVADGDLTRIQADDQGRVVIAGFAPRDLVDQNTITLSSTSETTLLAQVASTFLDLTFLSASNSSGTGVRLDIRDATTGTVRLSMYLAASGGGFVMNFTQPFQQTAVNNNWTAQLSAAVTDVRVTAAAVRRL